MRAPAVLLGVMAVLALTAACTSDVVDGRPVGASSASGSGSGSGSGSNSAPASGARFDDPREAAQILRDARSAIEAVNSYSYRDLPAARAKALRHLTGTYRDQYVRSFDGIVTRSAPAQRAVQRATVLGIGLGAGDDDTATVVAFGQLDIASRAAADRVDAFEVEAGLRKVGSDWLVERIAIAGTVDGDVPGTSALDDAVSAARSGVTTLLSFRRASFDADFAAALASTTGTLRADLTRQRATTSRALTTGRFDLLGVVRAAGVVSASGSSAVVLVAADGYRVRNGGRETTPTTQRLKVALVLRSGRWLLSALTMVGVR